MTVQELYDKHQAIYEKNPVEFSRKEVFIDGYKIVVFNYTKAAVGEYKLFKVLDAFEMRGLTFVYDKNDKLYKCFRALRKFYNVDENEDNTFDLLKQKTILYVNNKDDGSLIQFIDLPNGKIIAKTKNDFFGFHATRANELIVREDFNGHYLFIKKWLDNNHTSMFEYVSTMESEARVVLKYLKEDLILIRVRNNETGDLVDIYEIPVPETITLNKKLELKTLEEIKAYLSGAENIEGVVITWSDGTMNKWKCEWYCQKHYFRMDFLKEKFRENVIVREIINGTIDDVLAGMRSALNSETDKDVLERCIDRINYVLEAVNKISTEIFNKVKEIYDYIRDNKPERVTVYKKYCHEPAFNIISKFLDKDGNLNLSFGIDNDKDQIIERIYKYIEKNTNKLEKAKNFIKNENL